MRSSRRVVGWALAGAATVVALGVGVAVVLTPIPVREAAHRPVAATATRAAVLAANQAKSDLAITTLVNAAQPGCSAAVARHGDVVWAGAGGLADLATKAPDTTSTRFDIASVSKQFTATAILMLQRQGKLNPGTGFEYSNTNYVLLAEVVGRVSGTPLPTYLADHIFAPLGLKMVVAPTLTGPDVALSYDDNLQLQVSGWTAYGYSGIITTPSELARWGDQYRAGDIIQGDFVVGAVDEGTGDAGTGEKYAAGIDILVTGALTHSGRVGGYITDFTISGDRDTVIVVMCNGHTSPRTGLAAALEKIWNPTSGSGN